MRIAQPLPRFSIGQRVAIDFGDKPSSPRLIASVEARQDEPNTIEWVYRVKNEKGINSLSDLLSSGGQTFSEASLLPLD